MASVVFWHGWERAQGGTRVYFSTRASRLSSPIARLPPVPSESPSRSPRPEEDERQILDSFRPRASYVLTSDLLLRGLGFIYLFAFGSLFFQVLPLLGQDGLLPVDRYLAWIEEATLGKARGFVELPTLFWFARSDVTLRGASLIGIVLSTLMLFGKANVLVLLASWALYLSFVHVGQTFYGYGWEYLLLEAGLLGCFLAPTWRRPPTDPVARLLSIILFRWLIFRVMFGAGLIKIRGDACWTDLTCLVFHYETQPNPHPLSWLWHQAPPWFHAVGVLFNHFVELVVPFFVFGPRRARIAAGGFIIAFQIALILSGNLSFLNFLTIVVALSCLDDGVFRWICEKLRLSRLERAWALRLESSSSAAPRLTVRRIITISWSVVVAFLSLDPLSNLLASSQKMNASYNRLHLVNSYGAFGTVGRVRHEVIIEGTSDEDLTRAHWKEYVFPCKPGPVDRAPCWVTPYHHRLQWQMWFASFGTPESEPWLPHLVYKLLRGDESILPLLEKNPFPKQPPRAIRARLFEYRFTHFGQSGVWRRQPVGSWLRPLEVDDPELLEFLRLRRFLEDEGKAMRIEGRK